MNKYTPFTEFMTKDRIFIENIAKYSCNNLAIRQLPLEIVDIIHDMLNKDEITRYRFMQNERWFDCEMKYENNLTIITITNNIFTETYSHFPNWNDNFEEISNDNLTFLPIIESIADLFMKTGDLVISYSQDTRLLLNFRNERTEIIFKFVPSYGSVHEWDYELIL